jgi:hypothetical protein
MTEEIKIYGLVNPNLPNIIRYVGITSRNLNTRLVEHYCSRNNRKTPVANWIKKLEKNNIKPLIVLLDNCKKEYWEKYEKFYIKYFTKTGNNLVNYEPGGVSERVFNEYKKVNIDTRKKVVLQIDLITGELINEFESTAKIEEVLRFNKHVIASACRGYQIQSKGFHWEYKNEIWKPKLISKRSLNSINNLKR